MGYHPAVPSCSINFTQISHILARLCTRCTRKQLRLMDQGIKLREELSESKRKLAEADTLATPLHGTDLSLVIVVVVVIVG